MNIKQKNIVPVLFLLALLSFFYSTALSQDSNSKKFLLLNSVKEINKSTPDTCFIQGYAVSTYECPPCPPGAACKPCIGNYVMIADSVGEKNQFRVLIDKPDQFLINKKYELLILLHKTNGNEVYEATMLNSWEK